MLTKAFTQASKSLNSDDEGKRANTLGSVVHFLFPSAGVIGFLITANFILSQGRLQLN